MPFHRAQLPLTYSKPQFAVSVLAIMTVEEQARKYLAAIPPAISGSGGHSQTLIAARALVRGFKMSTQQAMPLLKEWNQTCQPPWTDRELEHKLNEAANKPYDKPDGHLMSSKAQWENRSAIKPRMAAKDEGPTLPDTDYDLSGAKDLELPKGKRDGFPLLLQACFRPGEGIRVMSGMDDDGVIRCDPNGGVVLSREEWLDKLDKRGGINGLYYRLGGPPVGVYLAVNPYKFDGRGRDSDVTDHRHCLLEFDEISIKEQWALIVQSNLPCAAVIYSGKKSLHAWVKIYAKDRKEYDERVHLVYNHFRAHKPDVVNKNPSRFSRCPDAKRGNTQQMLMALDIGASSFTEWSKHLLVQGIGTTHSMLEIENHNPDEDGKTILGNHYLRKGQSCVMVGPSGVGKSSLSWQMAMKWALGRECFGVAPTRPLKILYIQAENDLCDLHRMTIGIYKGLGIIDEPETKKELSRNLVENHNVADTGHGFIVALQRLIDHHEPDLVIADPLLSFIADDASRQEVIGKFCRNWLNPILTNSNVAFLGVHHTGKPPSMNDAKGKKKPKRIRRSFTEASYTMFGSSELVNWARATIILDQQPDNTFELMFCKRGDLAGATHPNGMETRIVFLRHSQGMIYWQQLDPPEEAATATESEPTKVLSDKAAADAVAAANLHEFTSALPKGGITDAELRRKLNDFAANKLGIDLKDPRHGTMTRCIKKLVENHKLGKENGRYVKGSDKPN